MHNQKKPRQTRKSTARKETRSKIPLFIAKFTSVDNLRIIQTIVNHSKHLPLLIYIYYIIRYIICQYHKSDFQSARAHELAMFNFKSKKERLITSQFHPHNAVCHTSGKRLFIPVSTLEQISNIPRVRCPEATLDTLSNDVRFRELHQSVIFDLEHIHGSYLFLSLDSVYIIPQIFILSILFMGLLGAPGQVRYD